jgi:MFS family permease
MALAAPTTMASRSLPHDARAAPPPPRAIGTARIAGLDIGVMFMGSTLVTPLYGLYREKFGFSELVLTLVYAAYVVGNLVALFLFGRVSDQVGRRRASLPAMALGALAMLVFLCADATGWLFVARVLSGLAIGVATGTGTAWVTELVPGGDKARSSSLATSANLAGIAAGPLLAGVLADAFRAPLRTPFIAYLLLLAFSAILVARLPETVRAPARLREVSFKPRLGVPKEIRAAFFPPAVAAFADFAVGGYYAGLMPRVVADLGVSSLSVVGAIVALLYGMGSLAVIAMRRSTSRNAMLWGLVLLLPGIGGLLVAKALASIAVLAASSAIGGVGFGLCYRGTLQVVNGIAPDDKRAEVLSSFMIACFLGNSLPVVGVALLSQATSGATAQFAFAGMVTVLAIVAFATGWRWVPKDE